MAQFMELTQFHVPGYKEAKTAEEQLEAVHRYVLKVLQAMDVKVPDYAPGQHRKRSGQRSPGLAEGAGRLPAQADELPASHPDLQGRAAQLPRSAGASGRVRHRLPFEQTGELSGMTRVRGFTQDDAHLFVTPEQVEAEMRANIDLVLFVLSQPRA